MAGPFVCTRCSTPLDAPTATGLCVACALATRDERPPAAPPAPETPRALDGTPAGALPNPFARTRTSPFDAPTASGPVAPEGDLPASPDGFTLIRRLGGGGMGDVYLAHEDAPNRFVAVKFMRRPGNAQLLERFRLEFRALANLDHPHSVRVFGYKLEGPAPYYAMELLEGGSVADRLRTKGALAAADAVALIRKVASAVQALHEHREHGCPTAGVVHRDIKPGNILLTTAGEPKLADFGLVKYLDAETITHTLQEVGTAQYMPPEQFNRANGEVSYPADVYGLGATLYHLLTGCAPFTGDSVFEVRDAVLSASPVRVRVLRPEVSLALEAVVLKCLAKDPADRYQTVAELLKALEDPEADSAPRYTRGHRARQWLKRHRVAVATAALGAAVLAAVAVALWPSDPETAFQETVRGGETAVLVPERGVPAGLDRRWLFNPLPITESTAAGRAASFESLRPALLAFLRDPGTDRYKVSMDVCVLRSDLADPIAPPSNRELFGGGAGLFLGHTRAVATNGTEVHIFLTANYHECLPPKVVKAGVKAAVQLEAGLLLVQQGTDPALRYFGTGKVPVRFPALATLPGEWRGLDAEVRPTGVRVLWRVAPAAEPVEVAELSAQEIGALYAKARAWLAAHHPQLEVPATVWAARAPFGVHGNPSALAFKNVSISPLK